MAEYKTLQKKRRNSVQCAAVLYSNWSLQMGQMGPQMTLGTLTMSGDDFPSVYGVLRGSNSVHNLMSRSPLI